MEYSKYHILFEMKNKYRNIFNAIFDKLNNIRYHLSQI